MSELTRLQGQRIEGMVVRLAGESGMRWPGPDSEVMIAGPPLEGC